MLAKMAANGIRTHSSGSWLKTWGVLQLRREPKKN